MRIRIFTAAALSAAGLTLGGCGSSPASGPATEAKAEALTDEQKAAFQAQLDQANNDERAQRAEEAAAAKPNKR